MSISGVVNDGVPISSLWCVYLYVAVSVGRKFVPCLFLIAVASFTASLDLRKSRLAVSALLMVCSSVKTSRGSSVKEAVKASRG